MRDARRVSIEHGRAHFPDDCPDTGAGNMAAAAAASMAMALHARRPPGKRVPFQTFAGTISCVV